MAWMKSTTGASNGRWYLTHEFSYEMFTEHAAASGVTAMLGFESEGVTHEQVVAELDRVKARRAKLIQDVAAAVALAIPANGTAGASPAEFAAAVQEILADDFAELSADINEPVTVTIT